MGAREREQVGNPYLCRRQRRGGMERKVGVASGQGGITYHPHRRALRNSSKREIPHAETLPANLSLLSFLEDPTWLGRVGALMWLGTFVCCSSPAQAAQRCLGVTSHHRMVVHSLPWPYMIPPCSILQHGAGLLVTSLPLAACGSKGFYELGVACGPWWVI